MKHASPSAARLVLALLLSALPAAAAPNVLWQIGQRDDSAKEFALAPGNYGAFGADGVFCVGISRPETDWPYVHPGPGDNWAGGRTHAYSVFFNLDKAPEEGECAVVLDLADTHYYAPPRLRIELNGKGVDRKTDSGSGSDAFLSGASDKGKETLITVTFPASTLRAGENTVTITPLAGSSWAVYDALWMEAPRGAKLAKTTMPFVQIGAPTSPPLLMEREGNPLQVLRVPVRHFGDAQEAEVSVDGGPATRHPLVKGLQTLEVPVPAADQPRDVALEVRVDGATARETATVKPARRWTVYLMHHTHLDIGYTHLQSEVEQKQWDHMDLALELIGKTRDYPDGARFKWLPEGLWAVDSYLKRATPEKRAAFLAAVKEGSIGLDALYGNQLTALCRPEELVELTGYARRLARETGVPMDTAMISDVPGYTWGLVPVLAQSGVKYLSIGPNAGHRIGFTLKAWGDRPYYWVSPSGKEEVLCWMVAKAYSWYHSGPMRDGEKILAYLTELQDAEFPYDLTHVRYNIGGDNGPPDPGLPDMIRDWNARYVSPKLVIATPHEAFSEFERRYGKDVPRVTGDFTPYWEDGAASSARETALNRDAAERIVQAQALWSMLRPGDYPAADFEAAWREVILYDEHTWGAHNSISEPEVDFVKGQWAVKQAFALEADRRSRDLLDRATAPLRARQGKDDAVMVLNTSPWPRTGLVTLPGDWREKNVEVRDAKGTPVSSQVLSTGELAFLASDVPPTGGAKYRLEKIDHLGKSLFKFFTSSVPVQGGFPSRVVEIGEHRLDNGLVSVEIDPATGAVSSLKAAGNGAELVDRSKYPGLNDYLYVAGRNPENPQRNGAPTITIKEKGPLVASLLVTSGAPGCASLTREVRLVAGLDHAELVDTLDKTNIYEKEGVHLAFPFNVPDGVVRMDLPLAVARPEADQMAGACKNYFTVQRWVDVSNDALGVTWAVADTPLVQVGGITNDPTVSGWIEKLEPSTTLVAYVMNNYWETNYKASQDGPTTFRYALRPHTGYDPAAAQRFGVEFTQPLVAVPAAKRAKAPETRVRITPDCVVATVLKPGDDGASDILRLFNASDTACEAVVDWGRPKPKRVEMSSLAETPGEPLNGPVRLAPYEVVTLRAVR